MRDYETPIMELLELETEDIVCASGLTNGGKDDGGWITNS